MRPMKQNNYIQRLDKPTHKSTFKELNLYKFKECVSAEQSNDFLRATKDISLTDDSFPEKNSVLKTIQMLKDEVPQPSKPLAAAPLNFKGSL